MFDDRFQLVRIGMLAVGGACAVFFVSRLASQLVTGAPTPWWGNAIGLALVVVLWFWFERAPEDREGLTIHGTAALAVVALLPPVAYGMTSTLWWLGLVPFAVMLMTSTVEGAVWTVVVVTLVAGFSVFGDGIRVPGSLGENAVEVGMARGVFVLVLTVIAWGFRREVERHTAELQRARGDLERSDAAKTRFMAQISHDLRNPLHGVLALTDLALQERLPEAARRHLRTSQTSARLLLRLLNDVLDATRAQHSYTLDERPIDLHRVLREVLVTFEHQARGRGLTLTGEAEPVPASRIGDAARITQVVMNLVTNALKFTDEGSIQLRLTGRSEHVCIDVIDTGRGIATQDYERIFDPFEQVSRADATLGGVGLGLSIARDLARRMGGDLTVVPREQGAHFRFELDLPVASDEPGPCDLLALEEEPPLPEPDSSRFLSVLVVDDDPTNRMILKRFCEQLGHTVTVAADGAAALELFTGSGFDAVLTDAQMPVMDGEALLRELRAQGQRVPVVVCTASGSHDVWNTFEAAGANAALWKPFVLQDVSRVLERLPHD